MITIEKIERGIITLGEFTEDQQSFIKGIVKLSFNEGQEQALLIHAASNSEKLYSVGDIHKIIRYMNKNYSKTEDELARPYEDKGEELPDDFFESAYNLCLKRAIESIG